MTFFRLLWRNLFYHWRGNLAVFLGVALGTAVLTGALLVGDSLRGSLRALTLDQLGWVDQALVAGRFFREELAKSLPAEQVSPVVLLRGSAALEEKGKQRRTGKVSVLGVDQRFWPSGSVPVDTSFWQSDQAEVVLNAALARDLGAKIGDRVTLSVQKADSIPRETLLGKRKADDVVQALTLTVRAILPDEGMGRFALKFSPEPARNAFVPLAYLQEKLELGKSVNALLAGKAEDALQASLTKQLTLADWGLRLRTPEDRARDFVLILDPRNREGKLKKFRWEGRVPEELAKRAGTKGYLAVEDVVEYYRTQRAYFSLESRQMFLEPAVVNAARHAAHGSIVLASPTLIYLADTISDGTHEVPYAVIGAVDPKAGDEHALVPMAIFSLKDGEPLKDDLILVDWSESPLRAKRGDQVTVKYYVPDEKGQLHLQKKVFTVHSTIPLQGRADDPDLTPQFPGITDKLEMGKWENPPFPYNPKRIKPADEAYWKRYRTTPKAYVSLETGQRLWGSRFGKVTSIRLAPFLLVPRTVEEAAESFRAQLLYHLVPEQGGFVFEKVKDQGLRAGAGSTDFAVLFLVFSFFLIVAALLLVGLLFRLNLDRRGSEIGLLLATGLRRGMVRRLLLAEGGLLALVGGALGVAGAVLYADFLLEMLRARWPAGQDLSFLRLHPTAASLAIGYAAAVLVSVLTILWATRMLGRLAPRQLLAGETSPPPALVGDQRRRWSTWLAVLCGMGAVACLVLGVFASGHEAKVMSFFGSGALLLIASLAGVWAWMRGSRARSMRTGSQALARLGVRNACRHPVRSLLTVGLLAAATFLVTAVESFHKEPGRDFYDHSGGSGGFPLFAESEVPVFQDLNDQRTRTELFPPRERALLHDVRFFPFRLRAGDDASCLNLYQPLRPRLLGVPQTLIGRGGFRFKDGLWQTEAEKANPWLLLQKADAEGVVPVIADANSAKWILKVGLGETFDVANDKGETVKLRIVALLEESIFQSEVLMSEENFLKLYPRQEGFSFFLIHSAAERNEQVKSALESALASQGVSLGLTIQRLESYLAVENTYLATFQALGGLGLLLGAVGLAIVLLRSIWERRGELALLRALGFRRRALGRLVLAENSFLLALGLAVGAVAALVAVAPHLLGGQGEVLWLRLGFLLALVLGVGLAAGAAVVMATLRAPLLQALRRE
jgi:putative ABC transport system permease protein